MADKELIFDRIANALLCDYTSVYYVNAVTNEYMWYSIDQNSFSLSAQQEGQDFFENVARDAAHSVYPDDIHAFLQKMQKDKLISEMKNGMMKSITYRLLIDGKPVYHELKLIRGISENDDYFILGVTNIDRDMRIKLEAKRLEQERETFDQIARSLAEHYDTIYYVDLESSAYVEFSSTDLYRVLEVPEKGNDFFKESMKNMIRLIHKDDQKLLAPFFDKQTMTAMLKKVKTASTKYRIIVDDKTTSYARLNVMLTKDKKHAMFCIENITEEMTTEQELREMQAKSITYSQIASTLADRYDSIYYVDSKTNKYSQYSPSNQYHALILKASGEDFFTDIACEMEKTVFSEDREKALADVSRENLLAHMQVNKTFSGTYRFVLGSVPVYISLRAAWAEDKRHLIIGLANIDDQIKRENEQMRALRTANEKAMNDELTGVRNKNAYQEFEAAMQARIDSGNCEPFGIVICDLNSLKTINDTLGHKTGDEFIKSACRLICRVFAHSPVFRIGGDEFVAVVKGGDYENRDELLDRFRSEVQRSRESGSGPIVASGLSVFDDEKDTKVSDVFERADSLMYENKKHLKS